MFSFGRTTIANGALLQLEDDLLVKVANMQAGHGVISVCYHMQSI